MKYYKKIFFLIIPLFFFSSFFLFLSSHLDWSCTGDSPLMARGCRCGVLVKLPLSNMFHCCVFTPLVLLWLPLLGENSWKPGGTRVKCGLFSFLFSWRRKWGGGGSGGGGWSFFLIVLFYFQVIQTWHGWVKLIQGHHHAKFKALA